MDPNIRLTSVDTPHQHDGGILNSLANILYCLKLQDLQGTPTLPLFFRQDKRAQKTQS